MVVKESGKSPRQVDPPVPPVACIEGSQVGDLATFYDFVCRLPREHLGSKYTGLNALT